MKSCQLLMGRAVPNGYSIVCRDVCLPMDDIEEIIDDMSVSFGNECVWAVYSSDAYGTDNPENDVANNAADFLKYLMRRCDTW